MREIFYFTTSALIVIVSLYIVLKIFSKKFNPEKSKVKLYGLMQGMTNREVVSLAISIVCYIFMLYLMIFFVDIDWYIVGIILSMTFLMDILIKNKWLLVNLLLSLVSIGGLYVINLIHNYIESEYTSVWMLLLLVFVMIFVFLYLTYTLLKNMRAVVISNKYIRKGGKNEN